MRDCGPLRRLAQLEHVAGREAREPRRSEGAVGEGLYVHRRGDALLRRSTLPTLREGLRGVSTGFSFLVRRSA
jgi:hypothetical protein